MNPSLGLAHFWAEGDIVTHATAIVLLVMSAASWYVILGKAVALVRFRRSRDRALDMFWSVESLPKAVDALRREEKSGILATVAAAGISAAQACEQHGARGAPGTVNASEIVGGALRQRLALAQAYWERGLTFLASVGATAPFIGLFGTVWGIYHALVGLSGSAQVVLERVAGPVGEALIMTAAGLLVAVPAVLAYNGFVRANRLLLAQAEGFAQQLHAYLTAGIRMQAADKLIDLAQARQARNG